VHQMTGDYPAAARVLECALGIYGNLGSLLGQANALSNLGPWTQRDNSPALGSHCLSGSARPRERGLLGPSTVAFCWVRLVA